MPQINEAADAGWRIDRSLDSLDLHGPGLGRRRSHVLGGLLLVLLMNIASQTGMLLVCFEAPTLVITACSGSRASRSDSATYPASDDQQVTRSVTMNPVNYFEIPVTDMARAMRFYERVLLVDFELTEIDGHPMALFPYQKDALGVTGALAYGESYRPGPQGVRIYFTVTDIDATLRRAVEAGGKVLYPKTSIGEHGWVAEFEDSEGNCIAIRSLEP